MSRHREIAIEIADIVDEKREAYGDSLSTTGAAMRLLYPQGVSPEQLDDMLLNARIWDKMSRAAHRRNAFGEDPFRDITGYGLRGVELHERREGEQGPCGCVSGAARKSKASSEGSAVTSASEPITPNASEPNVPSSTVSSAAPSTSSFASTAAPVRTATDLAFDDAVARAKELGSEAFAADVRAEVQRATALHGNFHSLHEAYAVLLEELQELWAITMKKRSQRDPVEIRSELVQIAAMAFKASASIHRFVDRKDS